MSRRRLGYQRLSRGLVAAVAIPALVLSGTHASALRPDLAKAKPKPKTPVATVCAGSKPGSTAPTANLKATDIKGRKFKKEPAISTNQTAIVTVSGFASGASVEVWVANATVRSHKDANANGVLTYRYKPAELRKGSYKLLFQGAYAGPVYAPPPTANVFVSVPRIGVFPFRVGCSSVVKAALILKPKVRTIAAGKKTTLTVTVLRTGSAVKLRVPVTLWSSSSAKKWKKIASGKTDIKGRAHWTVAPKRTTKYQVRCAGGKVGLSKFPASKSAVITVKVRKR